MVKWRKSLVFIFLFLIGGIILVIAAIPSNPTNLQPANNTILTDTTPNLNWTNATDADFDVLTYNLDISTSSNFNETSFLETSNSSNTTQFERAFTFHNNSYTLSAGFGDIYFVADLGLGELETTPSIFGDATAKGSYIVGNNGVGTNHLFDCNGLSISNYTETTKDVNDKVVCILLNQSTWVQNAENAFARMVFSTNANSFNFTYFNNSAPGIYSVTGIPSGASPTGHNVSVTLNRTTYHWRVRADDTTANGTYAYGNFTRNSLPTQPTTLNPINNFLRKVW